MRYNNYHKHDHKGNIRALDSIAKAEDYINRAIELNHNIVFSTEHGFQGDLFELKSLIDEKNKTLDNEHKLKMAVGCEFYYVDDINDRDRRNYHLIVVALNNEGCRQINEACSIANVDGFYYKPRIDKKILFEVFNPKDVIVTTACVAGILSKSDHVELLKEMKEHFGDNLFLEVQNHNKEIQKHINKIALKLSKELDIKIIHANDSHYIYPYDAQYRKQFLKAKGITYPEEDDFILDYPTSLAIRQRYIEQGVLNEKQIDEALNNTLVFDRCEEITIINDEIKLPSISKNPKEELDNILRLEWEKTKPTVNPIRIDEYEEAIAFERKIIDETNMDDYFVLDYHIVKRAKEVYNGLLTKTGRGSCVSFYINKLLGFTEIDRLDAVVPLYPTRFMSKVRILQTRSLPDIDLNTCDATPFIKATEDLLGKENCAWLISYKPLQDSSAFRLWCKSLDMDISEYNEIAKNLEDYENDSKWGKIIKDSKKFVGVIETMSPSPCSMVLYNKSIAKEIGLIKTKDGICCILDGYNCDKYKYLKND